MMNAIEAWTQFMPNLDSDHGTVSLESTETFPRNCMRDFRSFIARMLTVYPHTA